MRLSTLLLTACLSATLLAPGLAAKKHHRQSADAQAQALHRIHLAAKEKKAWRDHLAKLRSLPHTERVAEKRHERKWKREHDAKVAALTAAHAAKVAQSEAAQRQATRQSRHHRHALVVAQASPKPVSAHKGAAHARRVATLLAAQQTEARAARGRHSVRARHLVALATARQRIAAAHQENIAHREALVRAKLGQRQALRAAHLARIQALSHAHLANALAAHNARLAAGRAHWIALHGDGSGGGSIRFWQTAAAGVPVKVISVDLNDPNVKVSGVMARRGNGTAEPFRQMISRANPNVAVTGTFFSLSDLQPVGDIVINGDLVHFGGMGTALCVTPANHADMVTVDWGRHHDWSPYDFVVACGPRLLRRGRVVLDPRAERFHDRHMLSPNSRIAVGITRGNTLFFVMTHQPIYLGKLARAMQALGASDAMNLDAGTSTGFYYNGATLARPGRALTNMIVVYGRRDRYERALGELVPAAYRRSIPRRNRQISALPRTVGMVGR